MYQQLGDDADLEEIKQALYAASGADPFVAWRRFTERRLESGETVDVYLADLRRLAAPFGGANDRILAFLAGLPDDASRLLRASSRLNELELDEWLARARNILKDDTEPVPAALEAPEPTTEGLRCYRCGGPNHFSRDCRCRSSTKDTPDQRARTRMHCHRCDKLGHIARNCPGKRARGGRHSASLLPKSPLSKALPAVGVRINGCKRSALIDTGCTQTLVRKACCSAWEKKVPVLTVGGGSLVCCGVSVVHISVGDGP